MTSYTFTLNGATLTALPSGALYWPDQNLLAVSDLHFGKAERLARRGGALLPPFDTRETLSRLDQDIATINPSSVICLGDSFDDLDAASALPEDDRLWLSRLMAGRDWIWVLGNHDPAPINLGGTHRADLTVARLTFRHVADPAQSGEISGHYHPKARIAGQSRACFLLDQSRLIMPAYGSYTGGLWCDHPSLTAVMRPTALAILIGPRAIPIPMPR
ncbi:MAG: ligase-associated DNA damage response endonuclease PdeM [Rhodoferax sp.]|nr:ligase-associated DNA damage response endonuclease PdeM [Pseudorhodobacter sp.]